MALFGEDPKERVRVVEALELLGPTSVEGLASALAWSARRTTRVVKDLQRRGAPVAYDPSNRSVRSTAPPKVAAPAPAAGPTPVVPGSIPPSATAAGDIPTGGACPECRTEMASTGTIGSWYCPACGYLEASTTVRTTGVRAPAAASGVRRSEGIDDRQAQEMFAAWATARPIPCPRCHRPLNHRGVQSYVCSSCGEQVTFTDTGVRSISAKRAAA